MKCLKSIILAVCLLGSLNSCLLAEGLRVAADYWENCINIDNTGAYIDVLNEVFGKNNISYRTVIKNYDTCKQMFAEKTVDALIGVYHDEISRDVIYPKWHIDVDVVQVVFLKEKFQWDGEKTIMKKNVAWQKGFDMDLSTSVPVIKREVNSIEAALKAIKTGKCDFFLEAQNELDHFFKNNASFNSQDFDILIFKKKKLFLVFTPEAGKNYAELWDRELLQMLKDGRLKAIYDKYGFTTPRQSITNYYYELAK